MKKIRCTPDNAPEFRALIAAWPELNGLVSTLREQDIFPGMRGMRVCFEKEALQPGDAVGDALTAIEKKFYSRREMALNKPGQGPPMIRL